MGHRIGAAHDPSVAGYRATSPRWRAGRNMTQVIVITTLPTTRRSISARKASAARSIGKECEMCGRMTPCAASLGNTST